MARKEKKDVELPFTVSKSSRRTLVEQVTDGIRQCIVSGLYKTGDVIPTTRDLAVKLGVSRIVTRAAVRELAEAGLVNPKPSIGCVVLGSGGKLWNGRVLFVSRTDGRTYYVNVFTAALREHLVKAGWLFTQAAVIETDNGTDVSELELQLTHPVDLAVVMFDNKNAEKVLSRSGVPYILLGDGKYGITKGRIGQVNFVRENCIADFAAACKAAKVKSVLQVGIEHFGDVFPELAEAGIKVSEKVIDVPKGMELPESAAFAARDYFARKLAKGTYKFPDLIYFSDDYACTGALSAFSAAGIRIPEDVRVVTWSNSGNGPVYSKSLAKMYVDPEEHAITFAESVLKYFKTKKFDGNYSFGTKFVPGETFS